ncbi:MAG TPA: hypothetical protein VFL83_15110 [Anaeromyxobacter sp.]|nr:hypothetical protein [Anaeromyxobacter sp.]
MPWAEAVKLLAGSLEREPDLEPARWRAVLAPGDAAIAALRSAARPPDAVEP